MAERWWRETWMEAVYAQKELKPLEVFVASIYADHAHDRRSSWVTLARLMERTHLSRDAANRALRGLREKGWLFVMQEAKQHRATVYGLVIPESSSTSPVPLSSTGDVPLTESSSTPPDTSSTRDDTSSTPRVPNQSLIKESSISLSPEQELVAELLGLDRADERLQLVEGILEHHQVRSPKPWLRKCHANGELLDVLDSIQSELDADPEFADEGYMDRPGYVEGWGLPERVKIEDYYLSRIVGLGYDEEQARAYLAKAVEIYPTGTERKCWHEAYMTALNDTRCEECGCNPGNHSPICSQAPEQQDRAAS